MEDRIFYVPSRCATYDDFAFPGWDHPTIFGNDNPVMIEYCSGNGAWVAEKAQQNPHLNWIAVEKKFERVRKIWSKIQNFGLKNLMAVCGEAFNATWRYLPAESFAGAFINFPDPWPKKRHAKHRLIHPAFVQEIWRVLKPHTTFTLVTDDPVYSACMVEEMGSHSGFSSLHPSPYYITDIPSYGSSFFEQLWREKGRTIHFHQYRKSA